jgi:beta-lactamase regulating signal transducer with metallopeptidase domain
VIGLILPGVMAVLASVVAAAAHRRLRPSTAAPVLAIVSITTVLAVVWSLVLLAAGLLAHVAWLTRLEVWCRTVGLAHDSVPPIAGGIAALLLAAMSASLARTIGIRRRNTINLDSTTEVVVVADDAPLAYAVPGRRGHVVVSSGMLRALDDDERRVLLAHERAHLRYRHHRYIGLVDLSASAVPFLRPLAAHVRHATERWADEAAVRAVGDRRLVARAVAHAALVSAAHPVAAIPFAGVGVRARVDALLDDDARRWPPAVALLVVVTATLTAAGASSLQFHHLLSFAAEICIER